MDALSRQIKLNDIVYFYFYFYWYNNTYNNYEIITRSRTITRLHEAPHDSAMIAT